MIAGGAVSPIVADPDTTVAITTTLSTSTPTTALAALLVNEFRASHEYQALIIWFFHYPELAFDINTLGRWEDAPYGDWGRADEVDRGDYSKHQPYDRVKEKDWTLLPSKGQVDLYLAYLKTYDEMDSGTGDLLEDDDVFAAVADQFDVTSPDVEDAGPRAAHARSARSIQSSAPDRRCPSNSRPERPRP